MSSDNIEKAVPTPAENLVPTPAEERSLVTETVTQVISGVTTIGIAAGAKAIHGKITSKDKK
jgi:hypothetical protein